MGKRFARAAWTGMMWCIIGLVNLGGFYLMQGDSFSELIPCIFYVAYGGIAAMWGHMNGENRLKG